MYFKMDPSLWEPQQSEMYLIQLDNAWFINFPALLKTRE